MPEQRKGAVVINYDRDQVHSTLDREQKDHLVVNEIVNGKELKILEVQRRAGPLGLDDNNNNVC